MILFLINLAQTQKKKTFCEITSAQDIVRTTVAEICSMQMSTNTNHNALLCNEWGNSWDCAVTETGV